MGLFIGTDLERRLGIGWRKRLLWRLKAPHAYWSLWRHAHGKPQVIAPYFNTIPRRTWRSYQDLLRPTLEPRTTAEGRQIWVAKLDMWGFVAYGETREEAWRRVIMMAGFISIAHMVHELDLCCDHLRAEHRLGTPGQLPAICLKCAEQPLETRLYQQREHVYRGEANPQVPSQPEG